MSTDATSEKETESNLDDAFSRVSRKAGEMFETGKEKAAVDLLAFFEEYPEVYLEFEKRIGTSIVAGIKQAAAESQARNLEKFMGVAREGMAAMPLHSKPDYHLILRRAAVEVSFIKSNSDEHVDEAKKELDAFKRLEGKYPASVLGAVAGTIAEKVIAQHPDWVLYHSRSQLTT